MNRLINSMLIGISFASVSLHASDDAMNNVASGHWKVGVFYGMSEKQNNLVLRNSESLIYYDYKEVPLYGLSLDYVLDIQEKHFLGLRASMGVSNESYNKTTTVLAKDRNDGNPYISTLETGLLWGYHYNKNFDYTLGINTISQVTERNYLDDSFSSSLQRQNIELGVDYYLTTNIQLWLRGASDKSGKIGMSYYK
jgi:hypothetical protein